MKKLIIILLLISCAPLALAAEKKFSSLEGNTLSYKELVSASKTVLFLWTTWCPYCREELERLSKKCIFLEGVDVYFVNVAQKESLVKKFAELENIRSCVREKIILDKDAYLSREFSVIAIPTFLFFKDGQPVYQSFFLDDEVLRTVYENE